MSGLFKLQDGDIMDRNKACGGPALRIAIGISMLILILAGGAGTATLTVNASGGADYTRIKDALINIT